MRRYSVRVCGIASADVKGIPSIEKGKSVDAWVHVNSRRHAEAKKAFHWLMNKAYGIDVTEVEVMTGTYSKL